MTKIAWMDRLLPLMLGAALASAAGCGDGGSSCQPGSEKCSCFMNETCNAGLTCASNTCVDLMTTPGTGGTSGLPGVACGAIDPQWFVLRNRRHRHMHCRMLLLRNDGLRRPCVLWQHYFVWDKPHWERVPQFMLVRQPGGGSHSDQLAQLHGDELRHRHGRHDRYRRRDCQWRDFRQHDNAGVLRGRHLQQRRDADVVLPGLRMPLDVGDVSIWAVLLNSRNWWSLWTDVRVRVR